MDALDRLGWAAEVEIRAFGRPLGLRATEQAALDALLRRIGPPWRVTSRRPRSCVYGLVAGGRGPRPGVRRRNVLYFGTSHIAATDVLEDAVDVFADHLELHLAETAPLLFVHAGVVVRDGRALLLPGRSGAGKSTLVHALVEAGARYWSDEYAVIDERGRVHAYPRPIRLRDGRTAMVPAVRHSRPVPVGAVVETFYRQGARFRPRLMSPGAGLLTLLGHSVFARFTPEAALPRLTAAVAGATLQRSPRGAAAATAAALLESMA